MAEKTFDDAVLEPIESVLDTVGLMEGSLAPLKRTLVGAGIGAVIAFGIQPRLCFNSDGSLRPWSLTSDAANATPIPWWMLMSFPAVILGVLI
jgi:hypothetical protein